jgi:hypothetical protein
MPNTCPIIITRGKNKGKACGDVNKKCRHKNIECSRCGAKFTVETSFMRHQSQCSGIPEDRPVKPPPIKINTMKVKVKVKSPHPDPPIEKIDSIVLLQKIQKLEQELEHVKNKPTTVEHHHWNIVLGMNFFDELVHKMGKNHAINYLTEIAQEGKPVDVINKLYLEGTVPTKYPIACRDQDHFRYIDADHKVVDDKGGVGLSKLVSSGVHEALILAANEAIQEQVTSENYDCFNIEPIQKYVADMRTSLPEDRIINELAHITNIPNHPFFTDEDLFTTGKLDSYEVSHGLSE